jgi:1,2-diacylglycerol 3-alpha-glucosyltransferase
MKILIASDWYVPAVNGVVTSILNLQRELTDMGNDVRVLTLARSTRSYRAGAVTYIGAVSAGKIYPGARIRTAPARRLLQELCDWRPDVIHTQCEFSTFLMARRISAATGAPIVHTYHTVYEDYTHYFSPSRRWGRRAVAVVSRAVLSHTACVIVPTEKVRAILERYRVTQPIRVVPTGIDLRQFAAPADRGYLDTLKQKLGIPADHFVLVYVGRLAEEKNIGEIMGHLAALNRRDVTLLLVGGGPRRTELEDQARALGVHTVFTGMVSPSQVVHYYRLGDLFVSASSSETQGLTYLEAMAAGTPLLCRKDPCLSGVIADGVNGWQYSSDEEFCADLTRFLGDGQLRAAMARSAVETAWENFSSRTFAARALAVYQEVLRHFQKENAA